MEEVFLQLVNFSVKDQDYKILKNLNLELQRGEIFAIVGQDGSGKNAIIDGLIGKLPAEGRIIQLGISLPFNLIELKKSKIEIVNQKPKLLENMSISQNLLLQFSFYNKKLNFLYLYNKNEVYKLTEKVIKEFNANLKPNKKVKELTLEEKKNLAFIEAFAVNPNVVILYEPSENISLTSLKNLHSMIKRHKSEGKSVIYITKQWEDALRIADRIAILNEGEITEILSSDEVKNNPKKLIDKIIGVNLNDNSSDFNDNQLIDSVFEATEYLTSEYELNDLLNLLAENAAKAMKSDACEISLIDEETYVVIDKSIYKRNNSIEFIPNEAEILKLIDEERVYYFTKRDKGFERFFRLNNDICSLICVPFYICTY